MEPAKSIVARLGGPTHVAGLVGISPGGVSKWYTPLEHGGCGGLIPSPHIVSLCLEARRQRKFLEPNMFFTGHM